MGRLGALHRKFANERTGCGPCSVNLLSPWVSPIPPRQQDRGAEKSHAAPACCELRLYSRRFADVCGCAAARVCAAHACRYPRKRMCVGLVRWTRARYTEITGICLSSLGNKANPADHEQNTYLRRVSRNLSFQPGK